MKEKLRGEVKKYLEAQNIIFHNLRLFQKNSSSFLEIRLKANIAEETVPTKDKSFASSIKDNIFVLTIETTRQNRSFLTVETKKQDDQDKNLDTIDLGQIKIIKEIFGIDLMKYVDDISIIINNLILERKNKV